LNDCWTACEKQKSGGVEERELKIRSMPPVKRRKKGKKESKKRKKQERPTFNF